MPLTYLATLPTGTLDKYAVELIVRPFTTDF